METYTIYVVYTALPGKRQAFLDALATSGIPAQVRAEEGCLRYEYFLSLQNDRDILLIEEWETEAHQQKHVAQPHMAALRRLKEQYIAHTTLGRFTLER